MKKTIIAIFLLSGLLSAFPCKCYSQRQQGEIAINAGAGYSLMPVVLNFYRPSDAADATFNTSATPSFNGMVDYCIIDRFSIGAGAAYQSVVMHWVDYPNRTTGNLDRFDETVTRFNIGIRALYHFSQDAKLDGYTGIRFGYSFWTDKNNSNNPDFVPAKGQQAVPSFQALLGVRYCFTDFIGLHAEFGLGTPYLVEAGLSFKFGGKGDNTGNPSHHS